MCPPDLISPEGCFIYNQVRVPKPFYRCEASRSLSNPDFYEFFITAG